MATQIKITQLTNIGSANLAVTTLLPVVNMAGVPTTQKTTLGNLANVILSQSGGNYAAVGTANIAYSVANAAQPNITSVGTLTNVVVSGNANVGILKVSGTSNLGAVGNVTITGGSNGQVLTTNGSNVLSWTTVSGGGNGTPGGNTTEIQFNDAGAFAGNTGFTFNNTTGTLAAPFADVSGVANIVGGGATVATKSVLNVASTFGSNDANDPASAQAVRGRVTGANLTKTRNYVTGVTGQYLVTGTNASEFIKAGILGVVGDQTTTADGAVVAYLDGDGGLTTANAAYAVSMKNSTPNSGFNYGLDLQFISLNLGGVTTSTFKQADIRFNNGVTLVANTANNISINANVTVGNIIATNIGNIANINLDGSNSNVLYGNGVFASVSGGANTGNWAFVDNTMYNMAGGEINNGDPTHGATAGLVLPENGNAGLVTSLFNTYGNIGIAVANLANSANTSVWSFGVDGNLTLPANTFAVNYANGTQVSIGGGGNTGNVTFDDNIIMGTGDEFGDAGLYLAPGNASIANSAVQYLRVRGGDAPTHIHLDTGNNQFYDQYFGDDSKYVKLELGDAGNVVVGTVDANGNLYSWSFTSGGNLILANGNGVIQSIANSSLDTLNPNVSTMVLTPDQNYNSQSLVLDPTAPGHIHLRAYASSNIDEPAANIFLGGEDTAFEITSGANNQAVIHSNGKAWTFGDDGNISSDTLTFTTTFANVKTVEYQTAGVWDLYVEDGITGSNTASSRLNVSFKDNLIDQPQVYIENTKESDGIALRWTFDENGNLNFPRDVAGNTDPYLKIIGGPNPLILSEDASLAGPANLAILTDYLNLSGSTGNRIAIYADNGEIGTEANMVLYTNLGDPGNIVSWTLDTTGNLTLPGNLVIAGNTSVFGTDAALIQTTDNRPLLALSSGANGAVSSLWVEDIGNVGTSNIAAVYANPTSGSGIVRIAVGQNGGGGPNLWDFGATGNLTLPQGSQISETANTSVNITANANTWAFGVDGNLTVPGSIINDTSIVLSAPAIFNICTIATAGSGYNTGSSLKATTGGSGSGMTVGIGYGLSNQLTSVSVVNPGTGYVNGDVITVSEGTGGTFVITKYNVLANQTNNNTVQTDLIFANNTLTIPADGNLVGNLIVPGSIVSSGASPAPYISGFSSITLAYGAKIKDTSSDSVSFGQNAGNASQGSQAVAIGLNAGANGQANGAVAVGVGAGQLGQGITGIAIGDSAGSNNQGLGAVAIGAAAGFDSQGQYSVAMGYYAGYTSQANNSIILNATGANLNQTTANTFTVAPVRNDTSNIAEVMFYNTTSKEVTYGNTISVAGNITAGNISTGVITLTNGAVIKDTAGDSVSFGQGAGANTQGNSAVAIGLNAGNDTQGTNAVAIGIGAGQTNQGASAVAIGDVAGYTNQGVNAVAIGKAAGATNQANNTIILNATGNALEQTVANTFTVAPVRNDVANIAEVMFYNATSKEVTYGNTISVAGNITGGNISTAGNITGNTNGFAIGYLNIPQVSASNATLALGDAGKHYYSTTAGNLTLTIPLNSSVPFTTGTAISIVVQAAGNILVNAASGVTLYMAGNSTAANRAVGGYGMATLMKVGTDTWFINGTGVV